MRRLTTVVLACVAFSAPLAAQAPVRPGCYDLALGVWAPAVGLGADSLYMAPPTRVVLRNDETTTPGPPDRRTLDTAPGALPSILQRSWWAPAGEDTIQLVWTSGLSGLRMRLAIGDTLRGTASTFWDFPRTTQSATVVATPVDCAAPLPAEARFSYRYMRGIGFVGSDSIRIGEEPPASRPDLQPAVELMAPFTGAESVGFTTDGSGIVRRIVLHYPDSVSHADIVTRLTTAIGPATRLHDRPEGEWAYWLSRTIDIAVVVAPGTNDRVWVELSDPRR